MKIDHPVLPVVAGLTNKQPPAQAARAALVDQPELGDQPFGKLVSAFARGVPLPSASGSDPVSDPVISESNLV